MDKKRKRLKEKIKNFYKIKFHHDSLISRKKKKKKKLRKLLFIFYIIYF
jgi:hypothetical protein